MIPWPRPNAAGKIVLFPEIASALEGNRVFHSAYDAGALGEPGLYADYELQPAGWRRLFDGI